MSTYRVFMDYNASFCVDAIEIEGPGGFRPGLQIARTSDGPLVRFIKTIEGDYLNVDHVVRIMPMPDNQRKVRD